jgi:GNAT superfamily N-acetyltransferase
LGLPKSSERLDMRPLDVAECGAAAALSQAVGWPHRVEDWQFVLSVGHGIGAWAQGRLLGTALWWHYPPQVRLGMVIVDPVMQGAGLGRALMQTAMARIGDSDILLNATAAGEPLYRKLGFEPIGSIVQHQGASVSVPPVALRQGERIRPLGRTDAQRLAQLDAQALGAPRPYVIEALVAEAEAVVLDDCGESVGFAFCRRFGRGQVVGPVVARDTAAAKALISYWLGAHAGQFVRVDVTGESGLSGWLDELGFTRMSPVITMVRGARPARSSGVLTFAVANQALG